jgi:hypothetical protein
MYRILRKKKVTMKVYKEKESFFHVLPVKIESEKKNNIILKRSHIIKIYIYFETRISSIHQYNEIEKKRENK